jgi:glycine/D-amino acid oxidase-like deaminating enzyme
MHDPPGLHDLLSKDCLQRQSRNGMHDPMQNDPRSHGLWEMTAPPGPETQTIEGELTADVVIVGAGYAGLSSALHLAEAGIDAVVLEAVDIGFGGAGRNVGLVNAGMWMMPNDVIGGLGAEHGERLLELLGAAPQYVFDLIGKHHIDCEMERTGTLHCAVGRPGLAELELRAAQWTARGAPVRLLDEAETTAKIGAPSYAGALLDLRAGTIQPLAYARGLARAALQAGARIFTHSPAMSCERIQGKWIVRSKRGAVRADWIIVASDAYSHGPWSEIRDEQVHLPYFNFATEPLSENLRRSILPERQGAWDTNEILSSFRMDQAGRLIFGSVGALRGGGGAVHRAWATRAIRSLFPQIGDVRFQAEWYGMIGMTADNLPRFHKLAANVIAFSGYNGRGIAPGTTFGRILASYVSGRIGDQGLPLPVTAPKNAPLRRMKEMFYEIGAQMVHAAGNRFR